MVVKKHDPAQAIACSSRSNGQRTVTTELQQPIDEYDGSAIEDLDSHNDLGSGSATRDMPQMPLRDVLESVGIFMSHYPPGTHKVLCPACNGGSEGERSLSVTVEPEGNHAVWNCFRASCGWSDGTRALLKRNGTSIIGTHPLVSAPAGVDAWSNGYDADTAAESSPELDASQREIRGSQADTHAPKQHIKGMSVPYEEEIEDIADDDAILHFFLHDRCISLETVRNAGVGKVSPVKPPNAPEQATRKAIAFPYRRDGKIVNAKFRCGDKTMWQSKGGEKILFGLEHIRNAQRIVIVEGEFDKLALDEAGIQQSVSVPDGAPPPPSSKSSTAGQLNGKHANTSIQPSQQPTGSTVHENVGAMSLQLNNVGEDRKFAYLHNCRAYLDTASAIVLAVDGDEAGQRLAEELARRLGKERCYTVQWPEGCKDANDVLLKAADGARELQKVIANARPWPIRGLHTFNDYWMQLLQYWQQGLQQEHIGMSTGWESLDQLYRVVPGELSIVTGIPNSGKSEWLDALAMNLAQQHNWVFALCSLENKVHEHGRKLLEKFVGRPFFNLPQKFGGHKVQRMREDELKRGFEWINQHFVLLRHDDDQLPSIDYILEVARIAVLRYGIRGLVIDPYNELDHRRPASMSETEYVSQMLSKVKRFASHHGVHVWLVAHPRQLHQYKGDPPGLYDISGSAHFINKADAGLVVHRNNQTRDGGRPDIVGVHVNKMRNKVAGQTGTVQLRYEKLSGKYVDDVPEEMM